tara:strand:- start:14885 stop:15352 length:468 start_codon:yes stop_codon:yes gene_type:complete
MTDDRSDRGDGRDAKGRWVDRSGNPNGRPCKIPDFDMADFVNFGEKTIKLKISGEETVMTQHEAVLQAMFQSAMKGRITAQRYLLEHMAEATLSVAFVQARYAEYSEALATNPNSIPDNIKNDMERVMRMVEYSTARPRSRIRMTTPPKQKRRRS